MTWSLRARPVRLAVAALLVAGAVIVLLLGRAPAETASQSASQSAPRPYLALGDSVVFGYITGDGYAYTNAKNFVGYPDYLGRTLRLSATNAACPGETTAGFLSASGTDNGCRAFRGKFPLHVAYSGTQLAFATSYLGSHPDTRLVTLGLGANDTFVLRKTCNSDPTCIGQGLPSLLVTVSHNIDTILHALRATRFHGVLAVVNYYSLDYADAIVTAVTRALNNAVTARAQADGAVVADAFSAFQQAAATPFAAGNVCKAGLLNANPGDQTTCDVHPSQSGQQLLAQAVARAYEAATHH